MSFPSEYDTEDERIELIWRLSLLAADKTISLSLAGSRRIYTNANRPVRDGALGGDRNTSSEGLGS